MVLKRSQCCSPWAGHFVFDDKKTRLSEKAKNVPVKHLLFATTLRLLSCRTGSCLAWLSSIEQWSALHGKTLYCTECTCHTDGLANKYNIRVWWLENRHAVKKGCLDSKGSCYRGVCKKTKKTCFSFSGLAVSGENSKKTFLLSIFQNKMAIPIFNFSTRWCLYVIKSRRKDIWI